MPESHELSSKIKTVEPLELIQGHCGWDSVTLILGAEHVEKAERLKLGLRLIDEGGGLEVGYLSRGPDSDSICIEIVDGTERDWTSMCGGLTQIVGKALVEAGISRRLGLSSIGERREIRLHTASGVIPLEIQTHDGRHERTTTIMDAYVRHTYAAGVEDIFDGDLKGTKVGEFIVVDIAELERVYPSEDFTSRPKGHELELVNGILTRLGATVGMSGYVLGMLFDQRPQGPGQFRLFPRFVGAGTIASSVPWEFQCGTGTITVLIALAHQNRISRAPGRTHQMVVEWGDMAKTRDPLGLRTSDVVFDFDAAGRVSNASFSHSAIEITGISKLNAGGKV